MNFPWRLCFRLLAILSALAALLIGCMGASLLNDQLGSVGFSIQAAPSTPREAGFRASGPGCPPGRLTFASDRTFWLPRCQSVPPGSASCSPGSIESAPRPSTAACSTTHVSRSLSPPWRNADRSPSVDSIDYPHSLSAGFRFPFERDNGPYRKPPRDRRHMDYGPTGAKSVQFRSRGKRRHLRGFRYNGRHSKIPIDIPYPLSWGPAASD